MFGGAADHKTVAEGKQAKTHGLRLNEEFLQRIRVPHSTRAPLQSLEPEDHLPRALTKKSPALTKRLNEMTSALPRKVPSAAVARGRVREAGPFSAHIQHPKQEKPVQRLSGAYLPLSRDVQGPPPGGQVPVCSDPQALTVGLPSSALSSQNMGPALSAPWRLASGLMHSLIQAAVLGLCVLALHRLLLSSQPSTLSHRMHATLRIHRGLAVRRSRGGRWGHV